MINKFTIRIIVILGLICVIYNFNGCSTSTTSRSFDPAKSLKETLAGSGHVWRYDINEDGRTDFIEIDSDGDGVIDRYGFDTDDNGTIDLYGNSSDLVRDADQTIILFIDGVPFSDLEQLWAEGYFREFYSPGRMVSPFPSMTYLSFTRILGTDDTPGYEELYFDRRKNRMEGGITEHLAKIMRRNSQHAKSFDALFGYKQPPVYSGLIYISTMSTAENDLRKTIKYLNSPGENPAIAYLGTTDGLAHKMGRETVREELKQIDSLFRKLVFKHKGKVRLTFVSDHGNNYCKSERIDLKKHLRDRGFKLEKKLRDSNSVVIPSYGLVGFAAVYLDEGKEENFAHQAVTIPGVDLAVYNEKGIVHVLASRDRGYARIKYDKTRNAFKYEDLEGDPLDLNRIIDKFYLQGKIENDGYVTDEIWFNATLEHRYTDCLRRIYQGAANSVENTADVILSFEDGYFYGSTFFSNLVGIEGTHGSLLSTSTLGFVMCNYGSSPDYIRSDDMGDFLVPNK